MLGISRANRGDTLIEVLFAITVFSLIVVSSLALMNQGSAAAQRSLEITLVRQQIDNQAEALRFLHSSYVQNYYSGLTYNASDPASPTKEYAGIIQLAKGKKSDASAFGTVACDKPPAGSFILDTQRAVMQSGPFANPAPFSQVTYTKTGVFKESQGLWIEPVRVATSTTDPTMSNTGYIDFHIRACWAVPGSDQPMNLGTIVRLYEPRG